MQYKLNENGLFYLHSERWQRVGDWIRVLSRTRLPDKRHGHGALLEWKNYDGEIIREVVYARDLNSEHSRQIRDMLVDSGYPLAPGGASWNRLQHYLLEQMALAEPATVVNRTGWHGSVFATSNWTIGAADEPHHFVGQLSGSPTLQESGSLSDWQTYVGQLCRGNLLAIFCKAGFVVEEQVQGLIRALLRPRTVLACLGTVVVDQSQGTVAVLVWFAFLDSDFHVCSFCAPSAPKTYTRSTHGARGGKTDQIACKEIE